MEYRPLFNLISGQLRGSKIAGQRQSTSLAFDVSFQEIFATWCAGGALVLVDERARHDPGAPCDFIDEQRIARLFLALRCPLRAVDCRRRSQCRAAAPGGGDRGRRGIADYRPNRKPACATAGLHVGQSVRPGRSRDHCHGFYFIMPGDPRDWPPLPPIGRPIDNMRVLMLDEDRWPVPPGIAGEIRIGGAALARGYLNSPERQSAKSG
jgi:hypothetical protein